MWLSTGCNLITNNSEQELSESVINSTQVISETILETETNSTSVEDTEEIIRDVEGEQFPIIYDIVDKKNEAATTFLKDEHDKNGKVYSYSYYYYSEIEPKYKEDYLYLYNNFYDMNTEIELSGTLSYDEFMNLLKQVIIDNPDFYFVGKDWNVSIDTDTDKVVKFDTNYIYDEITIEQNNKALQEIVNRIKGYLGTDISDYDTYLFLHDYIVQNVIYNELEVSEHDSDVIGCLINKSCTCAGFAQGYKYLCRELGYSTALCAGTMSQSHLWNVVPYAEDWMYIDVGMDNIDSEIKNDWAKHNNFGISDEHLRGEGGHIVFDSFEDIGYVVHPDCNNNNLAFKIMQGNAYKIDDLETAKQKIMEVSINNLNKGIYFNEFMCDDIEIYESLREGLLNQYKIDLYNMLREINSSSDSYDINIERVGLSFEYWDKTVLIYFFKE